MGLLNKVKNIFFEEVEVEEEVNEPKEKKEKKEKPVAKKIELPKAESRTVEKEVEDDIFDLVEEDVSKKLEEEQEREKRISMDFDEDDFKVDEKTKEYVDMPSVSRREKERTYEEVVEEEKEEEPVIVEEEIVEVVEEQPKYEEVYGKSKEETHGLYEGRQVKKKFTPTPVISPVYGILDKNYKKEDVVSKKEIRLSTPSNKKLDLDTIREKAYGDLSIDISNSMEEEVIKEPEVEEKHEVTEDTVYDLNTNTSPEVEKVTIGDADEYYNELGLEYNVDYKDNSTNAPKRRSDPKPVEEDLEIIDSASKDEKQEDTEELESNLFDLVDSMYEDKE